MYTLRSYQKDATLAATEYFQKHKTAGVIVLPTGAGKSLVIAELAKNSKGRVLVLAHVKELVEQNYNKYISYDLVAGIYSAGLLRKDFKEQVIFGSIQSVARANDVFFNDFPLVIIDECHRVAVNKGGQYQQVIAKLKKYNPSVNILGLTATPFRLTEGWIYQYHHRGVIRSEEERFFRDCIYELSLSYMIKNKYLTPPILIDSPVACYDFSTITPQSDGQAYALADIEKILKDQKRITPSIVQNIIEQAYDRQGVMLFTATVAHAKEVLDLLPQKEAALIIGDTVSLERDSIIAAFKSRELKYLVNVSVLTTGFDAPHVDLIAILRPTESISLYQQIVGRGLRLSEKKEDCLILDFTGCGHSIFSPEVGEKRPSEATEVVQVICPQCGFENNFWGILDSFGNIEEHFGRKCQGAFEKEHDLDFKACGYRFRAKFCHTCGAENDIAARNCNSCQEVLVDPDQKLKEAMALKDAHVMRVDTMLLEQGVDKKGNERLDISYYDVDGEDLKEYFYLDSIEHKKAFYHNFIRAHIKNSGPYFKIESIEQIVCCHKLFRMPKFVIARKLQKKYWVIREKVF